MKLGRALASAILALGVFSCGVALGQTIDDAHRGWFLTTIGGHPDAGFELVFGASEGDDDYLSLRCANDAPSRVLINVSRFRDAPYGAGSASAGGTLVPLFPVSKAAWDAHSIHGAYYHQFEASFEGIDRMLRNAGTIDFRLGAEPSRKLERKFPLNVVCLTRFEEACHRVWTDGSIAEDRAYVLSLNACSRSPGSSGQP